MKEIRQPQGTKNITDITNPVLETPFRGIGKPDSLRQEMTGLWSRCINKEERYVYEVKGDLTIVHSLKGNY